MELSKSYFLDGRIVIYQPRKGFRFSIDAPILADFINIPQSDAELLEIGGGCGIISLILAKTKRFKKIYVLEIQDPMITGIRKSVKENGLEDLINIIRGDFKNPPFKKKFDIILSNPPYIKKDSGKLPANSNKRIAKFEIELNMQTILENSFNLLKKNGSLYLIYPYKRKKELKKEVKDKNYFISKERVVFPRRNREPVFYMVELTKMEKDKISSDYIILEDDNGNYSEEIENILRGKNVYN